MPDRRPRWKLRASVRIQRSSRSGGKGTSTSVSPTTLDPHLPWSVQLFDMISKSSTCPLSQVMTTAIPCVAVYPRLLQVPSHVTAMSSISLGSSPCSRWRCADVANIFDLALLLASVESRWRAPQEEACPSCHRTWRGWLTLSLSPAYS